jgi:2-hydroxymuconate-semialdehyde hydrolase
MERLVRECFATDPTIVTTELVQDRFEASARPGAHEAMQRVFAGLATAPALDPAALAGFTAPVLLLHGREDRIVPADNGLRLAELLPHADLHLLADTGHWLQIERARTVNTLVTDFLTRCLT